MSGRCLRTARACVLLVAGVALNVQGAAAPESAVILNGGFESGKAPWWGTTGDVVKEGAAEGQAALRLTEGYVAQDKRPIEGGKRYRITMQIRSDAAPDGAVFVQLSYRGPAVEPGWRGPVRVAFSAGTEPALFVTGGTHEWKPFSVVVEAPANANEILIYLRKKSATAGTAYYDADAVTPTDEPVVDATELKRKEQSAQLLQTGAPAAGTDAALLAAMALGAQPVPRTLTLAADGQARYRVHVGENTDLITLNAAAELARYLQRISGGNFLPLSNDANTLAGPLLIVGRENALTKKLYPDLPFDTLGRDGFVIRSVGPHVIIAGATPRGTLYGVNWFLDRKLGVKWLSPAYTYVPSAPTLTLGPLDERQLPRFAYREILSVEGENKPFRAHNLLNGESHGPSFLPSPPEINSWERGWRAKGGEATFHQLLPRERYGKTNPEWFAGGQVAMMNTEVRRIMAESVVSRLRQVPDYKRVWFDIHDMDWGWDMDPASKAFADKHGGNPSAPRLDMVIDIADRVRAVLPDAKLSFNAYHWSFTPPQGMKVPDYVLVFPMTIHVDYSTPLNQGRNAQLGKDIAGWNAIAQNVLVWDHIANFSGFIQPTPNIYPIGRSLQWLATLPNVTGYFAEGSWDTPGAEFSSLRVWMMARLLWNPKEDVAALVAEYCRYYYGDAGPFVQRYIDLMHAAIAKSGDVLAEKSQIDLAMLNLDFVRAADALFEQATAAVAGDPVWLAHVQEARLPLDYVILVRRKEYADEAARLRIAWDADTARRLARFNDNLKTSKVRQYRQGGGMAELAELLAVERRTADVPDLARALPKVQWVDFQDLSFNRYDSARIVQDAAASDGAAVRMIGNSSTWAVQFKLDKLPKQGAWDLYASVRVDAGGGQERETGARVGSYPPMGLFSQSAIGESSDGRYRLVKVPGGPFRHDPDHGKGVYVQAGGTKLVKYVYVDRLLAVRVRD
ncbi:MAG: DUF4838 domain-containing protein [Burkholderiales bacterium]